jgi:transcription-repair coupling factor (superfamily II helicase)
MNTLSLNALSAKLHKSKTFRDLGAAFQRRDLPLEVEGLEGTAAAYGLAEIFRAAPGPVLAVVATDKEADDLRSDLAVLGIETTTIPWWGTMPYRPIAPLAAVFGERAAALAALASGRAGLYLASQRAFQTPVPPADYLRGLRLRLAPGGCIDTAALAEKLVAYGYTRVPRVQIHGEFALRGEVLDILLPGDDEAYRVLFDFDTIESLRRFDIVDQSGKRGVDELAIPPAREVLWGAERIAALRSVLGACPEMADQAAAIAAALAERGQFPGEEMLYPLAFERPSSLLDYLGTEATVVYFERERLANAQDSLVREYQALYRKARRDQAVPAPERLLLDFAELLPSRRRRIELLGIRNSAPTASIRLSLACDQPRSFFGNLVYLKEEFAALAKNGWEIIVFAESDVQAARIGEILKELPVAVAALAFGNGFALPDLKLLMVQENEIFGRRRRPVRSLRHAKSAALDTFVELNPEDFVVHVNYGIGLFKGIERIKALGHERDYVKLEYADDETVFVPIEQVNLVQRYIGNEGQAPRLDKLGSKSWENRKGKVKKSVEDIAEKLIDLYSKRKAAQGFAFARDTEWQTAFEAAFPYEETEDQLRCVEEIKADMESPSPMDRLVCGDVGYGKTEVAVRACFKAVMGGKQVAFLAPTTILAEQHYENFQERFANFPVRIGMLSRFVEKAEIRKTLEAVRKGEIDILVGTHRLIQKDVIFKEIGLLVIDEEQRFGVKDKERLKELKTNIDCLTLSATPIPRTLHMSLLKIRDMSLLTTPPYNRHPIETAIDEYNEDRVAQAIRREVERGGQVFYLHNRVESLDDTRRLIERLVPEMLVDVAHGQMDPTDLEDVMHRFIHGGFHVLVSTTIIENGIDIPNVNTIVIDRADMYGVSQLYQLRGRVGRSDRVAYAYLFYPKDKALSELAMKRLQVISDFTELGSGFKIAMKDMEIRGAGNLLGREQSGDIYSVGFDLYLRLLDEAVRRLQDADYQAESETYLELEYSGFIPDGYIDSAQEKMEVYKKIASIGTKDELERVYCELLDRFGPLPDEAQSLLALAEIRIIGRELAVAALKERGGVVRVEFSKVAKVKVDRILRLMKESAGKVKLDPRAPNVLILQTGAIGLKEKSEFIREKLAALVG